MSITLTKAWADKNDRALLRHLLKAANVSPDAVAAWTVVKPTPGTTAYGHAVEIMDWIAAFDHDAETAAKWSATGNSKEMSAIYAKHGWSPEEARRLNNEVFVRALASDDHTSDQTDWVDTGLPPEFVFVCFDADIGDHRIGQSLYKAARKTP